MSFLQVDFIFRLFSKLIVESSNGGVVELVAGVCCRLVETSNGRMVELAESPNNHIVEWWNDGMVELSSRRMVEIEVEQWSSGPQPNQYNAGAPPENRGAQFCCPQFPFLFPAHQLRLHFPPMTPNCSHEPSLHDPISLLRSNFCISRGLSQSVVSTFFT